MPTVEERFATALHSCARGWRLAVDRRLKDLGLSQAGWMTIAMAAKSKAPLSQTELAQRVGVEDATLVAMLDRLAKAGLVVRTPSEADRRVKHVVVTAEGSALYDKVRVEAGAVRKRLLAGLDAKSLTTATELLEKIDALLEQGP